MNVLSKTTIDSPLGKLVAIASKRGLCVLTYEEESHYIDSRIQAFYSPSTYTHEYNKTLQETKLWLKNYFAKNFENLTLPAIDLQGTPFTLRAWKALLKVPLGKTQSYGQLAKRIGSPDAARAIGGAMGKNPITIMVPCHRILGATGTLTGYSSGLNRKKWLLNHEGIF